MNTPTFESIAGYEREKAELERLCEVFKNRDRYESMGARMPKGIIFYGEAGTGKTLFARVLANACGLETFRIDLGDVEDASAICKLIRKAFETAKNCGSQAMVFFDEVDKVLPCFDENYVTDRAKTILAQLLTLIDGMDGSSRIIFVGTCNDYEALPETLIRPGRIDKKISIGMPSLASRTAILKMYAEKTACTFEMPMKELASLTAGFSCAALETLVNECVLCADEDGFVPRERIRQRFFEIEREDIPRRRSLADDTIRACRNLGSFVVARSFDEGDYTLSLKDYSCCNDFFNAILSGFDSGYFYSSDRFDDEEYEDDYEDDYDEDGEDVACEEDGEDGIGECSEEAPFTRLHGKTDYLRAIAVRLGGMAAEELMLGEIYENVKYDLNVADEILFSMSELGMFGISRRYSGRRDEICMPDSWTEQLFGMFDRILEEQYGLAKEIVAKNRGIIKKLMPVLADKGTLSKEEAEPLLEKFGGIRI